MAAIRRLTTGECHRLSVPHLIGRSRLCTLQLTSPLVSGKHAVFLWSGSGWELRDLHSSNGTFIDHRALTPGDNVPLDEGTRIAFGDPEDVFVLADASPPVAEVLGECGERLYATDGVLALPDEKNHEYILFEKEPGSWWIESSAGDPIRRAHDGQLLACGGRSWKLSLPVICERTLARGPEDNRGVGEIGIQFRISRNEEHVECAIVHRGAVTPLRSRAHGYLLLTLARARLRDRERPDVPEEEHGWCYVSDLMKMLRTTKRQLNLDVHRARQQFRTAGVVDYMQIIERREDTQQIRIGLRSMEIVR